SASHSAADGQPASPGRRRENDVRERAANVPAGQTDSTAAAAARDFKKLRLCMGHLQASAPAAYTHGPANGISGRVMSGTAWREGSSRLAAFREGLRAERHRIRDFWQWLGMSGDALGT